MRYTSMLFSLLIFLFIGCRSSQLVIEPPRIPQPLELDPTEEIDLSLWWSNGHTLLLLQPDQQYSEFDNNNRYHPPSEFGQWRQTSYATIWLYPYTEEPSASRRLMLSKVQGELKLTMPRTGTLRPIKNPPRVTEDDFVGVWRGLRGELILNYDATYQFRPTDQPNADAQPVAMSHSGRWFIEEDSVILIPATVNVSITQLAITKNEGVDMLVSGEIAFRRMKQK